MGMKILGQEKRARKFLQTLYPLVVAGRGFEPLTFGLWARRATRLLHPASNYSSGASLIAKSVKLVKGFLWVGLPVGPFAGWPAYYLAVKRLSRRFN